MTQLSLCALLAVLVIASCSQPRAHAGIRITPGGVTVMPSVSTSIAGVGVSVSP